MSLNVASSESAIGQEVLEPVHKPQNALMHQKMQQRLLDGVVPVLTALVEEGNAAGVFHTGYPRETTEMLILYSVTVFDDRFPQTPEEMMHRAQALIHNTEILLGAREGSMAAPMARIFQQGF